MKEIVTIKATGNKSARTFTIRKYINGKFTAKYRTTPMGVEEFEEAEYNTKNDWKAFLRTGDYYNVK